MTQMNTDEKEREGFEEAEAGKMRNRKGIDWFLNF
jgi:hypothetical protein